jgi:putative membrane protein
MSEAPAPLPSTANELAKERNRAAAERTLLAWIRTSLSLIGFGFGIDRIVEALRAQGAAVDPVRLSRIFGLAFIALGIFAMAVASYAHLQELRRLAQEEYRYTHRTSLSYVVAAALIAIGLAAFLGILLVGGRGS